MEKKVEKYRVDSVISQPYYFVNSIIRIYSQSGPICSFVEPSLTTYRTGMSNFGNDEIHLFIF